MSVVFAGKLASQERRRLKAQRPSKEELLKKNLKILKSLEFASKAKKYGGITQKSPKSQKIQNNPPQEEPLEEEEDKKAKKKKARKAAKKAKKPNNNSQKSSAFSEEDFEAFEKEYFVNF